MKQRLQKIISDRGIASRRKAEELIRQGRVSVNGQVAILGDGADPDIDQIRVEGTLIPSTQEYIYLKLNKPRGYVTTLSDEKGRPTAASLVKDCGQRVYPVGRLDMDSEGLLLFTNDGAFANRIMHPSHEIEKAYLVPFLDTLWRIYKSCVNRWYWTATRSSRPRFICGPSEKAKRNLRSSFTRAGTGKFEECVKSPE